MVDASNNQVLFSRKARRARILASNSKLFTTATALGRFEPQDRLETTAWSTDDVSDGVSQGLYLRGGGDPTLSGSGLAKLADRVRAAGVKTVQGPLVYDDSFLDHVTGIPQHGISAERIGTLSALTIDSGSPGDPAKSAAQRFQDALRKDGVSIGNSVTPGVVPPAALQVGDFGSPTMADLIQDTNVPSNNFFAEMLLKDLGGAFGGSGSTAGRHRGRQEFRRGPGRELQWRERVRADPAQQGLARLGGQAARFDDRGRRDHDARVTGGPAKSA